MSRAARIVPSLLVGAIVSGCYQPTVARQRGYHSSDADLSVTRIVHGSAIIDFRETRIVLDPWYSPSPPLGQSETIGISVENLPPLRGFLITHQHEDHFDPGMLAEYPDKSVRIVARRGLGERLREIGYGDVVELEDWEQSQIGGAIVTAVPASHRVPENGYVLQANSLTVYVAGDTMFDRSRFQDIVARFPAIDLALLPVGGTRVLGRRLDMTPEQAALACKILKPAHVIPYHYGLTGPVLFVTTASQPAQSFAQAIEKSELTPRPEVVILDPGESWHHYR
ncbi:MAG: MBL fold metallo-hydrolase [Candidatus Binatia bacterium]